MRRRHLVGVAAIEAASNGRPWSRELFEEELVQQASRCFVAVIPHATVVGFGCLMTTGFETHVTNLAVDSQRRRQGIGRLLLARLIRESLALGVDAVTLEVRATNQGAQELYRGFGFAPGGIRPRYYADTGEDALVMWAHGIGSTESLERLERFESPLAGARRMAR